MQCDNVETCVDHNFREGPNTRGLGPEKTDSQGCVIGMVCSLNYPAGRV